MIEKIDWNKRKCNSYMKELKDIINVKIVNDAPHLYKKDAIKVFSKYEGTCIKTHELEEGIYEIDFWFRFGFTNITWTNGRVANVVW